MFVYTYIRRVSIFPSGIRTQRSCSPQKVEHVAHSNTLLPLRGTVSQGFLISVQKCGSYLCEKLSQPAVPNILKLRMHE